MTSFRLWASAFLALTVLVGAWLRIIIAWPAAGFGVDYVNLRHAHSHVAFFGWITLGLFGVVIGSLRSLEERRPRLGWAAHAIGVASIAAFLSFLRAGYDTASILISAIQVLLWIVLVARGWPVLRAARGPRGDCWRVALVFLLLAGASTLGPGMAMARGVADAWTRELLVKLFLALFLGGFVIIGSFGALYGTRAESRLARPALALAALGVPATAFLHVRALPPEDWVFLAGRIGTLLVAGATILVAADNWRESRARPLLALAMLAAVAKGVLELIAAAGIGLELTRSQPVVVAYLHLVLLGLVVPTLLATLAPGSRAVRRTLAYALGVAVMVVAVAISGWPWALTGTVRMGVTVTTWLRVAAVGGVLTAAAAWSLLIEIIGPMVVRHDFTTVPEQTTTSRAAPPRGRARTG